MKIPWGDITLLEYLVYVIYPNLWILHLFTDYEVETIVYIPRIPYKLLQVGMISVLEKDI